MPNDDKLSVSLPFDLVERVERQWERMHRDSAVAAISPRFSSSAAVRVALHLALVKLEAEERAELARQATTSAAPAPAAAPRPAAPVGSPTVAPGAVAGPVASTPR